MWANLLGHALTAAATTAASQSKSKVPEPQSTRPYVVGDTEEPAKMSPLMTMGGDLFKTFANRGMEAATSSVFSGMEGSAAGRQARNYYKAAFPGTNPWEHLGAGNPAGQMQAAARNNSVQERMQARDLKTKEKIAGIQANTQLATASIGAQAPNIMARIARAKLPAELGLLDQKTLTEVVQTALTGAQARLTGNKSIVEGARAEIADQLASSELNELQSRRLTTLLINAMENPERMQLLLGAVGPGVTKAPKAILSKLHNIDPKGKSAIGRAIPKITKWWKERDARANRKRLGLKKVKPKRF